MIEPVKIKFPVANSDISTNVEPVKTAEELEAERIAKEAEDKRIADELEVQRLKDEKDKKKAESTSSDSTFNEGQVIELDGVELTIDKDGNAIDKDNKIIKTAVELADLSIEEESTIDYIKEIQTKTNLVINNDNGEPVVYENTVDGITKYTEDVFETGKQLGAIEHEQKLLNQFPIIKDVINHIKLKGSLDGFTNKVDYSKITLDENDEEQWQSIYLSAQTKRGIPEDEAKMTLKYLKEDGKLKDMAQSSLKYLSESQSKEDKEIEERIKLQEKQEIEADTKYWNTVKETVLVKGKLQLGDTEITIPKVMRINDNGKVTTKNPNDFLDYITVKKRYVIDNQYVDMTAHQFDVFQEQQSRTVNDDVYEALNRFLKQDKSQIITAQIKTAAAKQIIKLTNKTSTVGSGGNTGNVKKLKLPV